MQKNDLDIAGKKILWVEDDYYRLRYLLDTIKDKGAKIIPARSYLEALSLVKDSNVDLIILDLIIPYSENEKEEPQESTPKRNGDEYNIDKLIRNGKKFFNYVVDDIHMDVPIIILSIVKNKSALDELSKKRKIKRINKLGRMPEDMERVILECFAEKVGKEPFGPQ